MDEWPLCMVTVYLRLEGGRSAAVSLPVDTSFDAVRGAVGTLLGCPSASLGLWCGGRQPADCTSLRAAGVLDVATIEMTGRLLGGMPTQSKSKTDKDAVDKKVCTINVIMFEVC